MWQRFWVIVLLGFWSTSVAQERQDKLLQDNLADVCVELKYCAAHADKKRCNRYIKENKCPVCYYRVPGVADFTNYACLHPEPMTGGDSEGGDSEEEVCAPELEDGTPLEKDCTGQVNGIRPTEPPTEPPTGQTEDTSEEDIYIYVGVAGGAAFFFILLVAICCCCRTKAKPKRPMRPLESPEVAKKVNKTKSSKTKSSKPKPAKKSSSSKKKSKSKRKKKKSQDTDDYDDRNSDVSTESSPDNNPYRAQSEFLSVMLDEDDEFDSDEEYDDSVLEAGDSVFDYMDEEEPSPTSSSEIPSVVYSYVPGKAPAKASKASKSKRQLMNFDEEEEEDHLRKKSNYMDEADSRFHYSEQMSDFDELENRYTEEDEGGQSIFSDGAYSDYDDYEAGQSMLSESEYGQSMVSDYSDYEGNSVYEDDHISMLSQGDDFVSILSEGDGIHSYIGTPPTPPRQKKTRDIRI